MSNLKFVIAEEVPTVSSMIANARIQVTDPMTTVVVEAVSLFQEATTTPGSGTVQTGLPQEFEYVATVAGAQAKNIGVPFDPNSTSLFINGLRQSKTSYSFGVGQLQLPAELQIYPDDLITFQYYPI